MANWVIGHFPPHEGYVEPFGGAASVLLRKPRVKLETYGDMDGDIVNFFQVLRERPDDLVRQIKLTAWSDMEYALAWSPATDTLERARRVFVRSWMAISGYERGRSGIRLVKDPSPRGSVPASIDFVNLDHLYAIASRLQGVQILNRSAFEIIKLFVDQPSVLIYADPPYIKETRERGGRYVVEMDSAGAHARLLSLLNRCAGPVVLSGYAHPLYTRLCEDCGWERFDKAARSNGRARKVESLWLNPTAVRLRRHGVQMTLLS